GIDSSFLKLNYLGTKEDRKNYRGHLLEYLEGKEVCETCKTRIQKNLMRIFDCKSKDCQKVYAKAPRLTKFLSEESTKEWEQTQELLHQLSISFVIDPCLVRGLDYYSGTVFEFASDQLGAQNAFCGGGRYDLGPELGEEKVPSVGAALGVERVIAILEQNKDSLQLPQPSPLNIVLPLSKEQQPLALIVADHLLHKGHTVDVLLDHPSVKSMMRKANKMGAQNVLLIGEDEQKNSTVTVKNMTSGESVTVPQDDITKHL
ncbi:histidine--tRNA ligase, partial [bacterium]|nr:histidine--tRNA ligase [bacterium]